MKDSARDWPLVSVITVNYNQSQVTFDLLASLRKITYPNIEIIAVDNASPNDNPDSIKRNYPEITLIKSSKNLGFAGGNNLGFRSATGKYIVLLNNDTIVQKDWLKELVNTIKSDENIGLAVSKAVYSDDESNKYKTLTLLSYNINLDTDHYDGRLKEIFFGSGCSLIYRRDLLDKPFDDSYFLYMEDMYLSWRIRMKGYRIKVAPDSKLKHFGSVTTDANFAGKTSFFGEKNRIMNIFLLYETKTIIKLIPLFVFTTVLHNLYHIKGIPYRIKSYFWLLTKISYIYKQRKKIQDIVRGG